MNTKKEKAIIFTMFAVLTALIVFSLFNWDTISYLFKEVSSGTVIVKEYVLSLGITGIIAMSIVMIICFFFAASVMNLSLRVVRPMPKRSKNGLLSQRSIVPSL